MFNFSFFGCVHDNGPHGECFRFVYNHSSEVTGVQIPIPISGVPAPDIVNLVWDDQPFGGNFPPGPPNPSAAANEVFGGVAAVPRFGRVGPAVKAHQDDKGVVYYTQAGVVRQEARWPKTAVMQRHPMGVCVYEYRAYGQNQPLPDYVEEEEGERLYVLKVKGIVQVLVDAEQNNITVGDHLEMQPASFNLILDAIDANRGTFIALENCVTDATRIWAWIVGLYGYAG